MITVFNKRFGPNGHKVLEMRGNLSRIYQCSNIYWGESINVYFSIFWIEGSFFMFGGFRILTFTFSGSLCGHSPQDRRYRSHTTVALCISVQL